jgi:hypothetical protein
VKKKVTLDNKNLLTITPDPSENEDPLEVALDPAPNVMHVMSHKESSGAQEDITVGSSYLILKSPRVPDYSYIFSDGVVVVVVIIVIVIITPDDGFEHCGSTTVCFILF